MRVAAAVVCAVATIAAPRRIETVGAPQDSDRLIFHVLNRVGFGPRQGDVDRVRALGVQKYIAEQLRPEKLRDANAEARLAGLSTLTLSSREIAETFELPQLEARRQRKVAAAAQNGQDGESRPRNPMQQRANLVVVIINQGNDAWTSAAQSDAE